MDLRRCRGPNPFSFPIFHCQTLSNPKSIFVLHQIRVTNKVNKKSFYLVSMAQFLKESKKERILYVIVSLGESSSAFVELPSKFISFSQIFEILC